MVILDLISQLLFNGSSSFFKGSQRHNQIHCNTRYRAVFRIWPKFIFLTICIFLTFLSTFKVDCGWFLETDRRTECEDHCSIGWHRKQGCERRFICIYFINTINIKLQATRILFKFECFKYWTDNDEERFGQYCIRCVSKVTLADRIERKFIIREVNACCLYLYAEQTIYYMLIWANL